MAKTSYIDLVPELESSYYANLQPGDRYTFSRIRVKNTLLSKKTKKGVSARSLLPEISVAWAGLSGVEKTAWVNAAAVSSMRGWNLFVQDFCARRVNELSGLATPSLLHQSWVGQVHIEAPATECKLVQIHPKFYYVMRKITGTKSMYAPVLVTEGIYLPFSLSVNYSAYLVAEGADPYAKMYAEIWYSYQGRDLTQLVEIDLDLQTAWKNATASISSIVGIVIRYNMYIHLHNLRGDLFIDNVKATHNAVNWARDPFCKDINQGFTRNFYQIPKHWTAQIAPPGVIYETVYKDF